MSMGEGHCSGGQMVMKVQNDYTIVGKKILIVLIVSFR
jgi:hypothetical protein